MGASEILDDVQRRLVAMADDPPYRFLNSSAKDADAYQRQLKTFVGYTEQEVAGAEHRLGVAFPAVFRTYLLRMGRACGSLFRGSDVAGVENFEDYRDEALELMAESGAEPTLPPNAVVFLSHQGYTFLYTLADGSPDSPVYQYMEGEREPKEIAPGFAAYLEAEVRSAEQVHREQHEQGGYDLTVYGDGSEARIYPALGGDSRPVEGHERRGAGGEDEE